MLHQALVHYSLPLSRWLTEKGYKLHGRNDLRFVETMYRALRDVFSYKPDLTREQFLAKGFAERKMIMSTRILELCQEKHKELSRCVCACVQKQSCDYVSIGIIESHLLRMYMPRNLHNSSIQILWFMSEFSVQCVYVQMGIETLKPLYLFCFVFCYCRRNKHKKRQR